MTNKEGKRVKISVERRGGKEIVISGRRSEGVRRGKKEEKRETLKN